MNLGMIVRAITMFRLHCAGTVLMFLWAAAVESNLAAAPGPVSVAVVVQTQGQVEIARAGAVVWDEAHTNQLLYPDDQLRTAEAARATIRMSDQSLVRVGELSHVRMPPAARERSAFELLRGLIYFFHRDRPGDYEIRTRTVSAIVRGTEFSVQFGEADGTTLLSLFDGAVEMTNEFGGLALQSGQQAIAEPGKAPRLTSLVTVQDPRLIQWCLYYPGVLYLPDLNLSAGEKASLSASLEAYAAGDLVGAYRQLPAEGADTSLGVQVFRAATSLAVGKVEQAEQLLAARAAPAAPAGTPAAPEAPVANAVRRVIELVRAPRLAATNAWPTPAPGARATATPLPTELLVESLEWQKRTDLEAARASAQRAVQEAPDFAFGWARVAELEFSFGRSAAALRAVEKSLALAPRHAGAYALKGFLLAARDRSKDALAAFEQAIALDGNLDNAWLGRGLVQMRLGHPEAGRRDLQTAVTLNPERALLRSYLGKAYHHEGDAARGLNELLRAISLDANDPTAWLYAALLKQQQNRVNEAIEDLERAQELNQSGTRGVVRSRLLLDQDRAVAGANLAGIYLDAGMTDVSLREAVAAVNADYTSYRSHLFLANSYNALRDPLQINLRYETPWLSEYLVSTLLAPVGAGVLSPYVSEQEYSRLFEADHAGVASSTEYRSNGDWEQSGVQYGTFGNTSYAVDALYRSLNGYRINHEVEQLTLNARVHQQITPADSVFVQATYYDATAGDVAQRYDAGEVHQHLQTHETQEPLLVAGYHHQWSENVHTLLMAARFQDTYHVQDTEQPLLEFLTVSNQVYAVPVSGQPIAPLNYRSQFDGYGLELQQIWKQSVHTVVAGGRFQTGTFQTRSMLGGSSNILFGNTTEIIGVPPPPFPPTNLRFEEDFQRITGYGYYLWQALDSVLLTAGLAYDHLEYPSNFRYPPIAAGQAEKDRLLPKAGLIWDASPGSTIRAAYTRSLGGVAFDQSFRLEPSQVAGFNQAYRSLIPESVEGSIAGATMDTLGVALDQKFGSGTYLGLVAEQLTSDASRELGAYASDITTFPPVNGLSRARQELHFEEKNFALTLNQLIGKNWSVGARYRLSDAELHSHVLTVPLTVTPAAVRRQEATLQTVDLYTLFRHQSGFFGQFDAVWLGQSNRGYEPALPGDNFWQLNLTGGWSFFQRRLEVRTGVLNLTDQNYRLNPLNLSPEYPRARTWMAGLKFYF
jgi:tetratricopeptide (TPR) repeat protein